MTAMDSRPMVIIEPVTEHLIELIPLLKVAASGHDVLKCAVIHSNDMIVGCYPLFFYSGDNIQSFVTAVREIAVERGNRYIGELPLSPGYWTSIDQVDVKMANEARGYANLVTSNMEIMANGKEWQPHVYAYAQECLNIVNVRIGRIKGDDRRSVYSHVADEITAKLASLLLNKMDVK